MPSEAEAVQVHPDFYWYVERHIDFHTDFDVMPILLFLPRDTVSAICKSNRSQFAKEQGFYNITLNVWSLNEPAMKFYESCGLKPQKVGMELVL